MTSGPTNILLLMTDQHRMDTLGCYGNPVCYTPALDELASTGTRFDNGFTPTAICTPARATLLTGVLPYRHTLLANYERNVGYPEELDTASFPPFSTELAAAGYRCGHVGKWHVGKRHGPEAFGFDGEHYPGWGNTVQHPDYLRYLDERGLPPFSVRDEVRGTFPNGEPGNLLGGILDQPVEATFEYYLAERTIEKLQRYAAGIDGDDGHTDTRPFFLGCHWFGPHLPYLLPEEYYRMYSPDAVSLPPSAVETFADKPTVQRRYSEHWTFDSLSERQWRELIAAYLGYVTLIDEQIGRILAEVRRLGLEESTAVFFAADHGEFTGAHRLHDKGPAMYDDIYRIPLLARVPGAAPGHVERSFATLADLAPTFLELAGIEPPPRYQGRSLLPLVNAQEPADWPQDLIAEFHGHHFPYPQRMIHTGRYKLVVNPADVNELYDLDSDPSELHNRYDHAELADVRRELLGTLYAQLRDRGDNFYHWMTSMFEVGAKSYDTSLSQTDELSETDDVKSRK